MTERLPSESRAADALEEAVGLAFRVLKGIIVLLGILFLGSGFFTLESHEVGYVRRLGQLDTERLAPGIHWRWPVVDDAVRVDTRPRTVKLDGFDLYRTKREIAEGTDPKREGGLDPARDGYLLTGDANIVHVELAVLVARRSPHTEADLRSVDIDAVTAVLLERAAVHSAAYRKVESLLKAKTSFLDSTRQELQASLTALEAGLEVQGLQLARDLRPSPQTKLAFDYVGQASQQADGLRASAERLADRIRNQAVVEAARVQARASSRAIEIVSDAAADRRQFDALLPSLAKGGPERRRALEDRLLADALNGAFDKVGEVFLVAEEGPLRIRLERDVTKVRRELQDKVRKEAGGE